MPEEKKIAIEEFKRRLINGETISLPLQIICEKCNYSMSINTNGQMEMFVRCSNCGYPIWCSNYRRVPDFLGRLTWYCIENINGEVITDYKGGVRLFESSKAAEEYLLCCKLNNASYKIVLFDS